ncbi:MAG: FecR domain-containing protein, partial [Myxococcaceae bacterium]|nr:FecR domain-containing protein [Myxococcaceae bacterium]
MSERNFQQALKEAERARETRTLPPDAERRIRARVEAAFERRRRFVLPTWTLGLATAVAAVALVVYVIARPARGPAAVNGFVAEQGAAGELLRAQGDAVIATAPVQVVDPRSRIHVIADLGAALKREPQGVRVMSGTVEVSVDKRHAGEPPARVFVSDGLIEILGTRFTISQGAHGGQVTLHEGSIRFRATDGRERMLRPGETLSWPLPPKVATAPSTPAPLPVPGGDRNVAEPPVAPTPPAVASTT